MALQESFEEAIKSLRHSVVSRGTVVQRSGCIAAGAMGGRRVVGAG